MNKFIFSVSVCANLKERLLLVVLDFAEFVEISFPANNLFS